MTASQRRMAAAAAGDVVDQLPQHARILRPLPGKEKRDLRPGRPPVVGRRCLAVGAPARRPLGGTAWRQSPVFAGSESALAATIARRVRSEGWKRAVADSAHHAARDAGSVWAKRVASSSGEAAPKRQIRHAVRGGGRPRRRRPRLGRWGPAATGTFGAAFQDRVVRQAAAQEATPARRRPSGVAASGARACCRPQRQLPPVIGKGSRRFVVPVDFAVVDFQGGLQEGSHARGAGRVADLADDGTHQQRLPAALARRRPRRWPGSSRYPRWGRRRHRPPGSRCRPRRLPAGAGTAIRSIAVRRASLPRGAWAAPTLRTMARIGSPSRRASANRFKSNTPTPSPGR